MLNEVEIEAVLGDEYETFGELIETLRIAHHWSRQDLAGQMMAQPGFRMQLDGRRIEEWEKKGCVPRQKPRAALSRALGVNQDKRLVRLWVQLVKASHRRSGSSYSKQVQSEAQEGGSLGAMVASPDDHVIAGTEDERLGLMVAACLAAHELRDEHPLSRLPMMRDRLSLYLASRPSYQTLLGTIAERLQAASSDDERYNAMVLFEAMARPLVSANDPGSLIVHVQELLASGQERQAVQGALTMVSWVSLQPLDEWSAEVIEAMRPVIQRLSEHLSGSPAVRFAALAALYALCRGDDMYHHGCPLEVEQVCCLEAQLLQLEESPWGFWWCALILGKYYYPDPGIHPDYLIEWCEFVDRQRSREALSQVRGIDAEDIPPALAFMRTTQPSSPVHGFAQALCLARLGYRDPARLTDYVELLHWGHCRYSQRKELFVCLGMLREPAHDALVALVCDEADASVRSMAMATMLTTFGITRLIQLFVQAEEDERLDQFALARAIAGFPDRRKWLWEMWQGWWRERHPPLRAVVMLSLLINRARGYVWGYRIGYAWAYFRLR